MTMFVEHAGDIIGPCDGSFLGLLLKEWFNDHLVRD